MDSSKGESSYSHFGLFNEKEMEKKGPQTLNGVQFMKEK